MNLKNVYVSLLNLHINFENYVKCKLKFNNINIYIKISLLYFNNYVKYKFNNSIIISSIKLKFEFDAMNIKNKLEIIR